jgi:hypothetical protein
MAWPAWLGQWARAARWCRNRGWQTEGEQSVSTKVLVLGDGTGGLVAANLLARQARRRNVQLDVRLIGPSPLHTYQPGLLFLPFRRPGYRTLADIQRPNSDFVGRGVE